MVAVVVAHRTGAIERRLVDRSAGLAICSPIRALVGACRLSVERGGWLVGWVGAWVTAALCIVRCVRVALRLACRPVPGGWRSAGIASAWSRATVILVVIVIINDDSKRPAWRVS